jgi:peptide/nickel transport system substrate-binding protein
MDSYERSQYKEVVMRRWLHCIVRDQKRCLLGFFSIILFLIAGATGECASPLKAAKQVSTSPQYGGVLKIITLGSAVNVGRPSEPTNPNDVTYANPAIETLVGLDDKGNPAPWLATGWKVAKDKKSIVFTLRKGVKFHDGTDFNAEAVKYVLDLYRGGPKPDLQSVASIDVVDDYTVRLNLSQFESSLLSSLAMSPGMMPSPTYLKTHDKASAMLNPVGTGPFKVVKHERDRLLRYEKFPGYWQKGKPYLDGIEFTFVADRTTALMSFKAGEAPMMMSVDPKDSVDLMQTGKYTIDKVASAVFGFAPDGGNSGSPFKDVRVRRAIEYAIDKNSLVKSVFSDVYTVASQTAPSGSVSYNSAVKGYPYNPKTAKELLTQAGFPDGFKTKIIYRTNDPEHYVVAIQGYLKDVGINAELEPVTAPKWTQIVGSGWENALVIAYLPAPGGVDPGQVFVRNLSSKGARFKSIVRSDKFETNAFKAIAEPDAKKRNALYKEMTKMITDDHAMICPVYVGYSIAARTPQVHDARVFSIWQLRWTPEDAWLSN